MPDAFDAETVQRYEHETWSRCAEDYLDGFAGLTRETLPFVIEAAEIAPDRRVLEIGSGPGHIAEALARAGGSVTGIDFSASMVDVARHRYPHLAFEEADAERLPFEPDRFDAVVSNFVVHHLARPEVVFTEVCRVLKPGGRFVFTVFASPEAQSSIGAFFAAVETHHSLDELPHGPLFGVTDLDLYESMLRAGGLTDPAFELRDITWRTASLDPIVASFRTWGNLAALPPDVQDRIEATAREHLEAYRREGAYAFPHEVLLGRAAKP
ncbi:MAG: class I SAM-dependent methyltransferase [Planctomycetota bacterium]